MRKITLTSVVLAIACLASPAAAKDKCKLAKQLGDPDAIAMYCKVGGGNGKNKSQKPVELACCHGIKGGQALPGESCGEISAVRKSVMMQKGADGTLPDGVTCGPYK